MSSGLYSGVSGLALGTGLYRDVSGLWSGASGLIAGFDGGNPYSGASLYLDFLTMTAPTFDSRITFSRGTNATLTDSTGKITYAPANLLTNSENFESANWTKTAATVTANSAVAPDGTTTADTFIPTTTATNHALSAPALAPVGTSTFSVYAKAAGYNFLVLLSSVANVSFNLSNGTVSSSTGSPQTSITPVGNGWYRCSMTIAITATSTLYISGGSSSAAAFFSGAGDGTSGIFIWGAQLEQVTYQTTPSTYQATTSTAYYGPRFDYDPVTLAARGLLIEEQRTNLATYSQDFTNAVWTRSSASISGNTVNAPDGTQSADTLTAAAATASHYTTISITWTAAIHTVSVYVKKGTQQFVQLTTWDGTISRYANFDLNTGAVGSVSNSTSSITAVGDGWYRITLTTSTNQAAAAGNITIAFSNSASAIGNPSYTTAGTETFYIWGAQVEAGAFATSYIPTVASQVTRNADVATMTGTNFSSWFNASAGTLLVEASVVAINQANNPGLASLDDNTNNNRVLMFQSGSVVDSRVVFSGTLFTTANATSVSANTPFKAALAFAAGSNQGIMVVNGNLGTASSPTGAFAPNRLAIGGGVSLGATNGHIRTLAYFNTRQPNTQLQTLTAPSLAQTLSLDFINNVYNVGF